MAQPAFYSQTQFETDDFNKIIYYMATLRDLGLIYFVTSRKRKTEKKDVLGNDIYEDIYIAIVNVNSLLAEDLVKHHGFEDPHPYKHS